MRPFLRLAAGPLGIVVVVFGLWLGAWTLLLALFAGNPPDPSVPSGDPCCGYPDSWTQIAIAAPQAALGGAITVAVIAVGVALVRWALVGRWFRWRTLLGRAAAGGAVLVLFALLVMQVVPGRIE